MPKPGCGAAREELDRLCPGAQGQLLFSPTGEDLRSSYLLSSLARCKCCCSSIVATRRMAKQRYLRTIYRCAYYHKRGSAVCRNNIEIRQDLLDSAVLQAVNEALDLQVLETSVAMALARLRTEQQ